MKTTESRVAQCSVKIRKIMAVNVKDKLFESTCTAEQLHCKLENSIIIWNKNVIIECPIQLVTTINDTISNGYILESKSNNKKVFKITKQVNMCNNILYQTSEGLLISQNISFISNTSEYELDIHHKLLLSEYDGHSLEQNEIIFRLCLEKINSLRNLEAGWNRVIVNGVEIIVFKKSSVLFMPTCININNITALTDEKNNMCFNSIPVKSKYFGKGYLSEKLIITSTSELRNCSENIYVFLPKSKQLLIKNNNKLSLERVETQSFSDSSLKLIERNFLHYSELLKTDNLIEEIKKNEINNDKIVEEIAYLDIHSNKDNKKFYIVVSVIIISGIIAIISLFASFTKIKWFRNIIIVIFNSLFVDKANKNDRIELNYLNINKNEEEETINHIDKITVLF
jgi:hypothetical protein